MRVTKLTNQSSLRASNKRQLHNISSVNKTRKYNFTMKKRTFIHFHILTHSSHVHIKVLLKGECCPLMPPYLVSGILEIFLQFCLHFSENFSSGLLIYSQGKRYADTCFSFSAGQFCIIIFHFQCNFWTLCVV